MQPVRAHTARERAPVLARCHPVHGCRAFQHALHVWPEVKLLAAHQDLDGERQRFEKRAIPCDHGLLFFLRRERVVGGGDLKDRPVLTLRWVGRGEARQSTLCAMSRRRTNSDLDTAFLDFGGMANVSDCFPIRSVPSHPLLRVAPDCLYVHRSMITFAFAVAVAHAHTQAAPEIDPGPLPVTHEHQQPDLQRSICDRDQSQGSGYVLLVPG